MKDFTGNNFKNIGKRIKSYCQMKRKKILEEIDKKVKYPEISHCFSGKCGITVFGSVQKTN